MENQILQRNYSNDIRKTLDYLLKVVDIQLKDVEETLKYLGIDTEIKYEACIESLQNSTEVNQMTEIFKLYGLMSDYDQRQLDFIKRTIYIQAYTDFYVMERFFNKIEKDDPDFTKITYEIIEKEHFKNSKIYVVMLKCMEVFRNLSAYDKIIAMKNLTSAEDEMLKSINPFYEYEKNMYDVEITKELILRQIEKWKNSFGLDRGLNESISFIFKLYNLNSSNINKLFEELNLEEISNTQNEEEGIMFSGTFITKEILNAKLKEEYNAKEKTKK